MPLEHEAVEDVPDVVTAGTFGTGQKDTSRGLPSTTDC
jgi:hypothetical protein